MLDLDSVLGNRLIVIALTGPNGAGKSTFYEAFLSRIGLLFVNADQIAASTGLDAYSAAKLADAYRKKLVIQKESFLFETVFSDPVGEKLRFLEDIESIGYTVVLIFIGIASPDQSVTRVSMRALQGGHDVPIDKLVSRFQRTMENLKLAFQRLQNVLVYDHSDLIAGYVPVASKWRGRIERVDSVPDWLEPYLPVD